MNSLDNLALIAGNMTSIQTEESLIDPEFADITASPNAILASPTATIRTSTATITSPTATIRTSTATIPSLKTSDDFAYEDTYVASGNSKCVLLAMATGLTDDNNQLIFDPDSDKFWKKCKAWTSMKPKKSLLRDEILRRQKSYTGEGDCKIPHTQKPKSDYELWLKGNTHISPANLQFVVSNFNRFAKNVMDAAGPSDNDAEKYMNFRGMVWILRIIHCLVENDDARIAFSKIYDSLDRSELDGKKNPETARVSGWQVIADHFNDPNFNPRSTAYCTLSSTSHSKILFVYPMQR